jgi:GNAT superfamily N-acetyltransferase
LFQSSDQDSVKRLILNGLVEHWGFEDPTKNPDLDDIQKSYRDATFYTAWCKDQLIGCGALVHRDEKTAEIVRMSVDKNHRRIGIGTYILMALLSAARKSGYTRVILETTTSWSHVISFYLNNGFKITHSRDGDTYFECLVE